MKDCVDEKLAAALHDVPVPEGLADRLLERLAAEPAWRRQHEELAAVSFLVLRSLAPLAGRWLLAGAGLLASRRGCLWPFWLGMTRRGRSLGAVRARRGDPVVRRGGRPVGAIVGREARPGRLPLQLRRCCRFGGPGGGLWRGVFWAVAAWSTICRGRPEPAPRCMWWMLRTSEGLPRVRRCILSQPAGCCASAWQEGGLLYVLVVQGDPATYRAF